MTYSHGKFEFCQELLRQRSRYAGKRDLLWVLHPPARFYWAGQECKALTALYLGHLSASNFKEWGNTPHPQKIGLFLLTMEAINLHSSKVPLGNIAHWVCSIYNGVLFFPLRVRGSMGTNTNQHEFLTSAIAMNDRALCLSSRTPVSSARCRETVIG